MLRGRGKKLIAPAIVLLWLLMMGVLVWHEVLVPAGQRPAAGAERTPTDSWLGVFLRNGDQVGYIHSQTWPEDRESGRGERLAFDSKLRLRILSKSADILMSGTAWAHETQGLKEFDFAVRSEGHDVRVKGTVAEGMLDAEVFTADTAFPLKLPVGEGVALFSDTGAGEFISPSLAPGDVFTMDAFDPATLSVRKARVECVGEETLTVGGRTYETKVLNVETQGFTTKTWVTTEGDTIRAETPFGFILEKVSPEDAMKVVTAEDSEGLIGMTAIQPTGLKPFRGARRMFAQIGGIPEGSSLPETGAQQRESERTYTFGAEAVDGATAAGLKQHLTGGPLVQVDHPDIRARAEAITAGAANDRERAHRIYEWVYQNVEKDPVAGIPSALDVLKTRQGDCNEHSVLFAALARAVNLPTRILVGVVWSDELDGFYYHAWPEVYAEGWTPMDPTLGQPVADATHVAFVVGDVQRWPELLPYIGQTTIEVLEIE